MCLRCNIMMRISPTGQPKYVLNFTQMRYHFRDNLDAAVANDLVLRQEALEQPLQQPGNESRRESIIVLQVVRT